MSFKDHFSRQADDYAKYRPVYPDTLFHYLAAQAPSRGLAWDAGTGSGQAALALAAHFNRVIATDPSEAQIRNAVPHPKVVYKVEPAEKTDIPAHSVDLITVAQALHWFDLPRFYEEAHRVLKPKGVLAAWCYGLNEIGPGVDEIVHRYYAETVGPFWPPERVLIDERYRTIPFSFVELSPPPFYMLADWNLDEYLGYLGTWSATQRYRKQQGNDPLIPLRAELEKVWGDVHAARTIKWPIHMRIGRT
ncbi:MAG: class I SAM-dependent methyltransferase [Gammaproteobacteria bacterium]|nr:MAG: class I SAM-dependent methyltransferase [Gammaproteobacteria bacterium]